MNSPHAEMSSYSFPHSDADPALASEKTQKGSDFTKTAIALVVIGGLASSVLFVLDQTMAAVAVAGGFVGCAVLLSPLVGICLLGMTLPLSGLLQLIPNVFTAAKGLAILVIISFLPRVLDRRTADFFRSRSLRWMIGIAFYMLLLIPLSGYPTSGAYDWFLHLQMCALSILVATIPRSFGELRKICFWTAFGSGILGVYIALYGVSQLATNTDRLNAGTNENELAFALVIGLILSAVAWVDAKPWARAAIVVVDLLAVATIVLTGSRAACVALPTAVTLAAVVSGRIGMKVRAKFFTIAVGLGCLGLTLVLADAIGNSGEFMKSRFEALFEERQYVSGGRTQYIWPLYIEAFQESPVIGKGLGFARSTGIASHNDWLKLAAESGIVGILFYAFVFFVFYSEARKIQDGSVRLPLMSLLLFILIFGQFHNTFALKPFALTVGVLAGLANLGMCARKPDPPRTSYPNEMSELN